MDTTSWNDLISVHIGWIYHLSCVTELRKLYLPRRDPQVAPSCLLERPNVTGIQQVNTPSQHTHTHAQICLSMCVSIVTLSCQCVRRRLDQLVCVRQEIAGEKNWNSPSCLRTWSWGCWCCWRLWPPWPRGNVTGGNIAEALACEDTLQSGDRFWFDLHSCTSTQPKH